MECCNRFAPEETSRRRHVEPPLAPLAIPALLWIVSAALTIAWSRSMSAMGGMQMPGGWTMSMMWMRMPGQTWPGSAASFVVMWVVMMAAMMAPSLVPSLWRYREALSTAGDEYLCSRIASLGLGYLLVWTVVGIVVYPAGAALVTVEMQQAALARAVPMMVAAAFLIGGALQFSPWKARVLACCRRESDRPPPVLAGDAWRHGLRLGFACACSCAGPTAILLAGGVMDLRLMVAVTAAITAERLAPDGVRVSRATGTVAALAGLSLFVRAAGLA